GTIDTCSCPCPHRGTGARDRNPLREPGSLPESPAWVRRRAGKLLGGIDPYSEQEPLRQGYGAAWGEQSAGGVPQLRSRQHSTRERHPYARRVSPLLNRERES